MTQRGRGRNEKVDDPEREREMRERVMDQRR